MQVIIEGTLRQLKIQSQKYSLVNNHGYSFENANYHVDIRHVLNVYGTPVNYWEISIRKKDSGKYVYSNTDLSSLTQEELLNILKNHGF